MSRCFTVAVAGFLVLTWAAPARAQCPDPQLGFGAIHRITHPPTEALLPESGYLSDTTYTSQFFGFSLDLPITSQGNLIMLPLMPPRQHALLAIGYQNGAHSGSLTIDAIEPRETPKAPSAAQPQQSQQQPMGNTAQLPTEPGLPPPGTDPNAQTGPVSAQVGPQVRPTIPGYKPLHEKFRSSTKNDAGKHTAVFWTRFNNYKVGVMVATTDKDFLHKAKQAMDKVRFYCQDTDGSLTTPDGRVVVPPGQRYFGPSVPTWRVDAAIRGKPGLAIPPGEVAAGTYSNSALGFQYELPKGWEVLPTNNSGDPPADGAALREFEFLHACSRSLLRAVPAGTTRDSGAHRPMIVLRALDPACLSLPSPKSISEQKTAEEVGASLENRMEFGQIASSGLADLSGRVFMVFHGTIAGPGGSDDLAQRMEQVILATRHKSILLVWSMIAPKLPELDALPPSAVTFDNYSPITLQPEVARK